MKVRLPDLSGEWVEAEYEPHEYAEIEAMYAHARSLPKGEERDQVGHSIRTLHDLKVNCGARMLSDADKRERGITESADIPRIGRDEPVVRDEGPIQTTMLAPEGIDPSSPFQIPKKALRGLGHVEDDERDNSGYTSLPDPGADRVGQFSDPDVSGAPETQRQAAILSYYKTGSDRLRVLDAIARARDDGLTDFEIEQAFEMKHQTASARRNDLRKDGWIIDSGKRRQTDTGREAAVWVLSDQGRIEWKVSA